VGSVGDRIDVWDGLVGEYGRKEPEMPAGLYNAKDYKVFIKEKRMKKVFFIFGFFVVANLCFAQNPSTVYEEYTFKEAERLSLAHHQFIWRWTKEEIQEEMATRKNDDRSELVNLTNRMLRAAPDKRVFLMRTRGQWSEWLFIKINDDEYVVFFTGN
jgi:hypothetical protein